ncbi:MAG: tryptophan synthase subunit alpha [Acidobacteria bacterium]|nr:tryptophan synthase subunit alpha [Acidobacteriota bacterium]
MSRIDDAFRRIRAEKRTGLITYVTAGDPSLAMTADILKRIDAAGADVLEVGVPFSDPLADGPVIQRATERALAGGATLAGVLDMIAGVRSDIRAPIVIFSYANPILRMGLDAFVSRAREVGVDGVLTLDVPPEESGEWRRRFRSAGIDTIFLLSPTTTVERIRRAGALGSGFLYGISRLGVTGARETVADSAEALAVRVRHETSMPLALGFGVSRPEHVRAIGQWADAAVVGSALVNVIAEHGGKPDLLDQVERYVRWLQS